MAQEVMRRSEYSPMTEPISALEVGPHGWVQQLNFVVFGVLTIGYAVGLHTGVERARFGASGPGLLVVSGIGLVLAAIFPLRQDSAGETYDPGGHAVAGAMFFSCSALGLILLSRRLKHDDAWRSLAGYTLGAGLIALAGFVAMFTVVLPPGAPLEDWTGLAQRLLLLLLLFPCRIALAVRLLKPASRPRLPRATARPWVRRVRTDGREPHRNPFHDPASPHCRRCGLPDRQRQIRALQRATDLGGLTPTSRTGVDNVRCTRAVVVPQTTGRGHQMLRPELETTQEWRRLCGDVGGDRSPVGAVLLGDPRDDAQSHDPDEVEERRRRPVQLTAEESSTFDRFVRCGHEDTASRAERGTPLISIRAYRLGNGGRSRCDRSQVSTSTTFLQVPQGALG